MLTQIFIRTTAGRIGIVAVVTGLWIACLPTTSKASSLLGYYTFDNSGAGTLGTDSSGNGNNLTISSSGATLDTSAKIGTGALSLDGTAGILTGDATKLYPASTITTGVSLSFYVQSTDSTNANNNKNISRDSSSTGGLTVSLGGTTSTTYRGGSNGATSINSGIAEDTTWRLVVISYNVNGTVNYYVDGNLKGTATAQTYAAGTGSSGFGIGGRASGTAGVGSAYFFGNLDDFAVYGETLSDAQDTALFKESVTPFTIDTVVPEPASLSLLGFGGLLMVRRRRSSKHCLI